MSWQTGVVVLRLVEPVGSKADVVTGDADFLPNKLVGVTDEVDADEDEFEVTLGDDEAAGDMVTAVDETKLLDKELGTGVTANYTEAVDVGVTSFPEEQ